jgi:hypothetical protein
MHLRHALLPVHYSNRETNMKSNSEGEAESIMCYFALLKHWGGWSSSLSGTYESAFQNQCKIF